MSEVREEVTHELISVTGERELRQRVCERFVESQRCVFAWLGRYTPSEEHVTPTAAAGLDESVLDEVSLEDESPRTRAISAAVETRDVQTEQGLQDDPPSADWGDHAREHGYRSVAVVPLVHENTVYGVLYLATDRPDAFDADEQCLLASMGETIAYALDDVESSGRNTEQEVHERAEPKLQETREELAVATKAASVGTWTWDIREDVVTADESLAEAYGMSPEEAAAGASMEEFYEPILEEDEEETWEQLNEAVEETGELETEYRVRDADGDIAWVMARGEVEYDDGEPIRMHGAVSDITERKQRERELEESERRYRTLAENFPSGAVAVYDDDLRFTLARGSVLGDTLPGRDQVEGRPVSEVYPPDIVEDLEPLLLAAVEDGETDNDTFEFGGRHWRVWATPLRDGDGDVFAGLSFAQNITERVEHEQELQKHTQIVETVEDGIYALDADSRFTMVNGAYCELTGYDREELLGAHASLVHSDETDAQVSTEMQEVRADGREMGPVEIEIDTADGSTVLAESRVTPFEFEDGTHGRVGVVRDVTGRKQRERELEQHKTVAETASDVIVSIDARSVVQSVNPAVEDVFGYERDELVGESLTMLMPGSLSDQHREAIQHYLRTGERTLDWDYLELPGEHKEGHEVPLGVSFSEYEHDGEQFFTGIIRDITERKQFEHALTSLHDVSRDLVQAETKLGVSRRIVDAAAEILDCDGISTYLFDDSKNALQPAASTEHLDDIFGGELPTFTPEDTAITWEAFINGETLTHDDVLESGEVHRRDTPLRSGIWVPLGDHGVLSILSEHVGGFDGQTERLADHLAATAEAALDRVEREESLRHQEHDLEKQNRQLQNLNRTNAIIREIDQALVEATTREAIEQAVCGLLTRDERFAFAWIGEAADEAVTPRTWAGDDEGYLDAVSLTAGGDGDPAMTTAATGNTTLVSNVASNLRNAPWRKAALARDLQSVISIPLEYNEMEYGLLTVYATQPDAFDELSQTILRELGETIANAMNVIDTRRALLADRVVELELEIHEADDPLVRVAQETDCAFEVQGIVPQAAGTARVFVTVSGGAVDTVRDTAAESTRVENVTLLSGDEGGDDESRIEMGLAGATIPSTLVECGAVVQTIQIAANETNAVVELPHSVDVRTFVDRLEEWYPDTELVARRDRERTDQSQEAFETALTENLTRRQLETLQTAYHSGYFEWPRDRTGEEIAGDLDITQPTFNGHLRTAERKLCAMLFDGASSPVD